MASVMAASGTIVSICEPFMIYSPQITLCDIATGDREGETANYSRLVENAARKGNPQRQGENQKFWQVGKLQRAESLDYNLFG